MPAAAASPVLIHSNIANHNHFPEVFYVQNQVGDRCTATLVGKSAIVTAAHCVSDSKVIRVLVPSDKKIMASCEMHEGYVGGDYDIAMCKTDAPIKDIPPASLSARWPEMNQRVMLMGYGCINPDRTGGNDGKLRLGYSKVYALPYGGPTGEHWFYTMDDAALCSGDSGGPAFEVQPDMPEAHHWVIGVNSRGNMRDLSLMTAVFDMSIRQFVMDWAKRLKVTVCGINRACDEEFVARPPRASNPLAYSLDGI